MHDLMPKLMSTAALAGAVALGLVAGPVRAQAPAAATPSGCTAQADRAAGLKFVPARQSLSDLQITIAAPQRDDLTLADITLLKGPCASAVYGFRMAQVIFEDGAVFTAQSNDRFTHAQQATAPTAFGGNAAPGHPVIDHAMFIMASNVEVSGTENDKRALDVGLWKTGDDYLVAAYVRQGDGFGEPVELLRSKAPLRSVTYFPSPDSSSGKLGLLEKTGDRVALISLSWNHTAFSKNLTARK